MDDRHGGLGYPSSTCILTSYKVQYLYHLPSFSQKPSSLSFFLPTDYLHCVGQMRRQLLEDHSGPSPEVYALLHGDCYSFLTYASYMPLLCTMLPCLPVSRDALPYHSTCLLHCMYSAYCARIVDCSRFWGHVWERTYVPTS